MKTGASSEFREWQESHKEEREEWLKRYNAIQERIEKTKKTHETIKTVLALVFSLACVIAFFVLLVFAPKILIYSLLAFVALWIASIFFGLIF